MRLRQYAVLLSLLMALAAPSGVFALAAPSPSLNRPPVKTSFSPPDNSADNPEAKLAERYATAMERTTNALEKVIEAQANQINVFICIVAVVGIGLTIAGFGLFRAVLKTVKEAVDDRVSSYVASGVDASAARSAKLHAAFLETTFYASRDIALSRQRDLRLRMTSGDLNLETPQGMESLVKLQADVFLFPLSVVSTMYALAADEQSPSDLREKTWVLFAEVAAGNITPRAMLQLVTALINILHFRQTKPAALTILLAFAKQLREAVEHDDIPTAPSF